MMKESQKIIFELLAADQPDVDCHPDPDSKFWSLVKKIGYRSKKIS